MSLAITSAPSDELLTVAETKDHLCLMSDDWDSKIATIIRAARDDCERDTGRTLRGTTTRTYRASDWWCTEWLPPYPPLLGITSITYYDADNAIQTLSSANYVVVLSTDGRATVTWATDADLPDVYDRPDAVIVTFTTGYSNLDAVPPAAVQGWKMRITELWGAGSEGEQKAAVDCAKRLLSKVDATSYV